MAATATATASERRWSAAFWASAGASAAPFLLTRYPPFADLPEHVVAIATLARLASGQDAGPYVVDASHSQYLLYHAAGAAITLVVGDAVLASQLLVAAVAVAWSVAFRSLLRATGRDERLALFAPMVFFNRALLMGFLPFVASVPLGLFAIGWTTRTFERPTLRRAAALGLFALALFYTHVSTYLLCLFILAAWTGARLVTQRLAGGSAVSKRGATFVLGAALPSFACALLWVSKGSLVREPTLDVLGAAAISRMRIGETLLALPVWTFDMWTSHLDEVCAVVWWSAFAAVLVGRLRRTDRGDGEEHADGWLALVPFACALLVCVLTPFRVGVATMLNVRLAPVLTLLAVVPLTLPRRRATSVALAGVVAATFVTSAASTHEMRSTSEEMVGDLDALLEHARPGTRLVSLDFDRRSPRTQYWPYVFAGSYHVARGGAVAAYSFAELPHWPIHYALGQAPPAKHEFWIFDPCAYRYEEDGAYYDYVLVHGDEDPFADAPGPPFLRVASSGKLTLYEKFAGPPARSRSRADAGPCRAALTARRRAGGRPRLTRVHPVNTTRSVGVAPLAS